MKAVAVLARPVGCEPSGLWAVPLSAARADRAGQLAGWAFGYLAVTGVDVDVEVFVSELSEVVEAARPASVTAPDDAYNLMSIDQFLSRCRAGVLAVAA